MKHLGLVALALLLSAPVFAQMKGMDMKGMDMERCKGMDMDKCHEMMMKDKKAQASAKGKTDKKAASHTEPHKGTGVVISVDRAGGKVTLKHDPIKSLNWPTMTMAFAVKDKAMLDSLANGKNVDFEFIQQGQQFVITSIK
jgi:Cu/Ag efflux protein CusF